LLLLAVIAGAFAVSRQSTAGLAQQSREGRSSLSEAQMNKMLALQQAFTQQTQQMVAEATRREIEQRQARIAVAERAYKEQANRKQAEQEKLASEHAVAERARVAQEAERQKAAEEKERIGAADHLGSSQPSATAATGKEIAQSGGNAAKFDAALLSAAAIAAAAVSTPQSFPSPTAAKQSDNAAGLTAMGAMLAGAVGLVAESPAPQSDSSPQKTQSSNPKETPIVRKLREAAEKFTVGRYTEAFKLYEEAIGLEPDNPKGYLARGWAFFSTSQKEAALKDFDEAIKRNPQEAEGYFRRGVVQASNSEHEEAITAFTKAIECRPDYSEAYYERGVSRAATKKPDKAREDFDNVVRFDPKNVLAYLNRGRAFLELKESDKALSDYNRAVELDNRSPVVFVGRGAAYLKLGKYESAQKDLEKALSLNPEYIAAYLELAGLFAAQKNQAFAALNRGRAYFYSKEYPKATADFERAVELQPKLAAAHLELGRSKSREALAAMYAARSSAKGDGTRRDEERVEAEVHQAIMSFAEPASASLKEATRLSPNDANAYIELGKVCYYSNRKCALPAFEKALKIDPKSADAHFWSALTKYTWGDDREVWKEGTYPQFKARLALKELDAAIELNPSHSGAYYFRARANRKLENYDLAVSEQEHAIKVASAGEQYPELRPGSWDKLSLEIIPDDIAGLSIKAAAYADRGHSYYELKNYEHAFADLDEAIRVLPNCARLFYLRGSLYDSTGNSEKALADFRRAAQLDPRNKQYADAMTPARSHSEMTFWEKAAIAMVGTIAVGVTVEMLMGDSVHTSSAGNGSSDPVRIRHVYTCTLCGGTRRIGDMVFHGQTIPCPKCGGRGIVEE
jgi:tetratricopeptide (TPR) repeat protein